MEQTSLVKAVAAFVAGVVVAMGGALIYVRTTDTAHSHAVMRPAANSASSLPKELPNAGNDTTDQANPPSTPAAASDGQPLEPEPIQPKKHKASPPARKQLATSAVHREHPLITPKPPTTAPPILIAQNTAPQRPKPVQPQTESAPAAAAPTAAPEMQANPYSAPSYGSQSAAPQYTGPAPTGIPVRQPHVVTLDSGTNLIVRLGENLSTKSNYTGDTFRATLDAPIIRDGFIIADKGSKVLGRIMNAEPAGRVHGVADLSLALTEINTTDGQRVRIQSSIYDKRGPTTTGEDAAKIGGGAVLGAIIGAVAGGGRGAAIGAGAGGAAGTGAVLATHGKPAVLPTETRLTFQLTAPVTITEKLNY